MSFPHSCLAIFFLTACDQAPPTPPTPAPAPVKPAPAPAAPSNEPAHVTVQHVLVSFKGVERVKPTVTRTQDEARELAREIFERAVRGEDFAGLIKRFSDDELAQNPEGKYAMANFGAAPADSDESSRDGMARRFGDVSFGLQVNQIGIAEFHAKDSPFGWHIIKRIK